MSAPRLPEVDALRGVAIVAVVGLHVSFAYVLAAPPGPATTAALAPHLLVGPGTPLFVALSMAGLALGYPRPMGFGGEYGAFLARRARRILPAYVFWTALTLLRDDSRAFGHPLSSRPPPRDRIGVLPPLFRSAHLRVLPALAALLAARGSRAAEHGWRRR